MTPPNLLTVYVARPLRQNLLIDFEYILQIQRKDIFLLRCLEFVHEERLSFPGQNIFYSMRCDNVAIPLEIIFVDSVKHCGKRSNLSLVHFMCSTFVYGSSTLAHRQRQVYPCTSQQGRDWVL